jgi:cell division protein FtsQ
VTEPRHGQGQDAPEPEAGGPAGPGLLTRESADGEPARRGPLAPDSLARTPSPWRTAFIALAAAGLVAGVAWALLGSRLFVVRSIVVDGTHLVPASQVRAAAAIPSGLPMIRVDTGAVGSRVEAITQVRSAQVSKSWPDRIVITVRERTPSLAVPVPASVSASGGYDLVDASGVIVRWSRTRPAGMPLYQAAAGQDAQDGQGGPGALRGSPAVAAAVTVLHEVPAAVARSVAAIAVPSPQAVTLRLANGVTIVWGSTGRASAKARELAILMRTHARYYDVSAPGSVVTR